MTTLTAFYDLAVGPPSFDFVVFGIKAEIERRRIGATRLHFVIVPKADGVGGMFRDKTHLYDEAEMRWRLWNILIPAAQLFGASVTLALDWLQAERIASEKAYKCYPADWRNQTLKNRHHLIGGVIDAARAGVEIPTVRASEHARRKVRALKERVGKPVVTITTRSTYLAERNSATEAWELAMQHIASRGWQPIWLRDTDEALNIGAGFGELNLDLRMASYETADLNLQANNGAASLCWFSRVPYAMFDAGIPAEEWDGLFVKQGLPLGATWPWAAAGQRLVYKRATAETIIEEFERGNR